MKTPLPEYDKPPIDEVALGVQFSPLTKLEPAHIGLYWERIRSKYPNVETQAPLPSTIEPKEITPVQGMFALRAMPPFPRIWFLTPTKTRLIQVQQDRFLGNWRQLDSMEAYPRFVTLREDFRLEWEGFRAFLRKEELGDPSINQCELTYVNQIESNGTWADLSDALKLFTITRPASSSNFLPPPEMVSWDSRYKLPDGRGRLHVQLQPIFRTRDMKLALGMTLTARGAPADESTEKVLAWFDLAHEWVVRGFDELTDSSLHKVWKKK